MRIPKYACIIHWLDQPPTSLPLDLLPAPLKATARYFFVLFYISI
jgi:hypothetical protein